MKIDAEGFDFEVLKGMRRALADRTVTAVVRTRSLPSRALPCVRRPAWDRGLWQVIEISPDTLADTVGWFDELGMSAYIIGSRDLLPLDTACGATFLELYSVFTKVQIDGAAATGNLLAIWKDHPLRLRLLRMYNEAVDAA